MQYRVLLRAATTQKYNAKGMSTKEDRLISAGK